MRRGALVILVAAILLPTPVRAQVFDYLAMGDSITAGSFDEQNKGGYPGRLDTQLGCTGGASSCRVYNKGVGGDTTAQMLSRINGVLGQRTYDVMLLMGGTNDIFNNISNNTIEFNLTEMYNRATSKGVDTVFASIIWFHPNGVHGTSKNSTVQNLRSRVINLASGRSGYMVDNWSVLCPKPAGACFNRDYYSCVGVPSNPPSCGATKVVDPVGHPDASGYDIMTLRFKGEIEKRAFPGVPVPTAPVGAVVASPSTYHWNREQGNVATWYHLEIDGPGGKVHSKWHEAKGNCGAGVCSVDPGKNLAVGTYSFRVRGRTPEARGNWSADLPFTVVPPPAPMTVAPTGVHYFASPTQFQFQWNSVATADEYELKVEDSVAMQVVRETYGSGVCSGSSCAATPSETFGGGDFRWQMRSANVAGQGGWGGWKDFTVVDSSPAASDPDYPDREIFNVDPLYSWTGVEHATYYDIEVSVAGGAVLFEDSFTAATSCSGLVCTGRAGEVLAPGNYSWQVTSGNPIGESSPSAKRSFTVLPCAPESEDLEDEDVEAEASVLACRTIRAGNLSGAGPYRVTALGDLTLHAGELVELRHGFSVLSGGKLTVLVDP